jgi:hypothetical protein
VSTGDVAGGAPRFSIPIDTGGGRRTVEGYAFLDAAGCGGASGEYTTVSTESSECAVNFDSVDYANWATFAAANPTYRIAAGTIPFIIADAAVAVSASTAMRESARPRLASDLTAASASVRTRSAGAFTLCATARDGGSCLWPGRFS